MNRYDDSSDPPRTVLTPRNYLMRLAFLLLLFGLALLAFVTAPPRQQQVEPYHISQQAPQIVPPTGVLAEVFEQARPATLQIELRTTRGLRPLIYGIGSGFFISPDGLVLTAYHVVNPQAGSLTRDLQMIGVGPDESRYQLELVGFDAYLDLAVLQAKVDAEVAYLPLADAPPKVGGDILAIGNSRGDFLQGRTGRVTRLGIDAPRPRFAAGTIQLTAALSPGDSGGPILTTKGEVVGVVSYISFAADNAEVPGEQFIPPFLRGLNLPRQFASFAVPVYEPEVLTELRTGAQRDWPVIGFESGGDYVPRTGGLDLGPEAGVLVRSVHPGSPAERAGLRGYQESFSRNAQDELVREVEADIIVAIDGERTPGFSELLAVVYQKNIGETVTLTVQRGQETVELQLELAAYRSIFGQ